MNLPADEWPAERVRAWTTALDAIPAAGAAAVAATAQRDLLAGTADALTGRFADWVIVDVSPSEQASRSEAGSRREPELAGAPAELSARRRPMIAPAAARR